MFVGVDMSKFCNDACIFILGAFILASFVAMIFLPIEYTAGYICCAISFMFINVINNMFESNMI